MDPRLRALYLAVIAIGVFFLPAIDWVAWALSVQIALWFAVGLRLSALLRTLRKLFLFLAVIVIAYALVESAASEWRELDLRWFSLDVNMHGLSLGILMALRVVTIVTASGVTRAGDPSALATGMRKLGLPASAALAIEAVLALLSGDGGDGAGRGGGRGDGAGRGGGRGRGDGAGRGGGRGRGDGAGRKSDGRTRRERFRAFRAELGKLARGDVGVLVDKLWRGIERAEAHLTKVTENDESGPRDRAYIKDVAIIAGIALTMIGIKALKLLPGLPFAPGHKGVLLIPLYIVAGQMTRNRFGATLTGTTMGVVAFLLGDGRWGVFEIAKHIAPGVLVDIGLPLMGKKARGALAWSLFGLLVALGRFATVTLIALAVQAPSVVFAFLLPGLAIHGLFGILSGVVTAPVLRSLQDRHAQKSDPSDRTRGSGGGGRKRTDE